MRKIAIVGMGPSEYHAPWRDAAWEVWALPWHSYAYHAQRLFEMHPLHLVLSKEAHRGEDAYLAKLNDLADMGIPLYMQKVYPEVAQSRRYPLEEVVEVLGRDYFGSSPAYPIAMAIWEHVCGHRIDELLVAGVDLSKKDTDHNRPNLEWLLGLAQGKGMKVEHVKPDMSKLWTLKRHDRIGGLHVEYPTRYGFLEA